MSEVKSTQETANNVNKVLCGVIIDCIKCKHCQHELWIYGYVCELSKKFLMSEKHKTISVPEWCELHNAT